MAPKLMSWLIHTDMESMRRLFFPERYVDAPDREESLAAFRVRAAELNRMALQVTGAFMGIIVVGSWWTDPLMIADPAALRWMIEWRAVLALICTGAWLSMRISATLRRFAFPTALIFFNLALAHSGYMTTRAGGPDFSFFYGVYPTPTLTVILVSGLPKRFLGAMSLIISYFIAVFATDPSLWGHPDVITAIGWSVGAAFTAATAGHVYYALLLRDFMRGRALDRRARDLEELDRLKNDFFANINHELRTPLTNILTGLRTLERCERDPQLRRAVDAGLRNASRLLRLVNDLLELSRINSGRQRLRREVLDAAALARQVAGEFQTEGGHRIVMDVAAAEEPVWIDADPHELRTVLYNLLSNAVKFSEPEDGPVDLIVDQDQGTILVTVRDRGIGIPEDQLEKVFERFHQVEAGVRKRRVGAGIGLSLVREIVNLHRGEVSAMSTPGQGTSFTVRLPQGDVSAPPATGAVIKTISDSTISAVVQPTPLGLPVVTSEMRRVLVCEDDPDLRAYLEDLLSRRYRCEAVADGRAGLDALRRERPDLVVSDIMMPYLSGLELLEATRSDPDFAAVPFLFLTALTATHTRLEALREGVNDYVQKPFDEEELLARVRNLLEQGGRTRSLEDLVADQTQELRRLAENLARVQEGERVRVAREIHDETGQVLTGLRMELDRAGRFLGESPPDLTSAVVSVGQAGVLLNAIHASVDRVINALRPSILETQGFVSALGWLGRELETRHGVRCAVEIGIDEEGISSQTAIALYRIVQEALTNVARHADATSVLISLEEQGHGLELLIRDDGLGFEPGVRRGGFGLLGIRERSRLLGGDCDIRSKPGEGTEIRVVLEEP